MALDFKHDVTERFLRYVVIDTQSDPSSPTCPSTDKQKNLGRLLAAELKALGLADAHLDEHGYVYATIPATTPKKVPVICFCSHMDTSPDCTGANVRPQIARNYQGGDIVLPADPAQLKLGGQRRVISALFADIRGFTHFSEQHDAVELVEILNQYLGLAAEKILAEGGTLDEFLGDAVMGIFNAPLDQPDHHLRAARAAVAIRDAIETHVLTLPPEFRLNYGIGLNSGEAVVGNVGTAQRLDYTAIGDSINYAKRLQENARGGQILLSQATYDQIKDQIVATELEPLPVKGRSTPEKVYELLGIK